MFSIKLWEFSLLVYIVCVCGSANGFTTLEVTFAAKIHASPDKHYVDASLSCLATCFCLFFGRVLGNACVWLKVKRALLSITLNLFQDFSSIFFLKKYHTKKDSLKNSASPLPYFLPSPESLLPAQLRRFVQTRPTTSPTEGHMILSPRRLLASPPPSLVYHKPDASWTNFNRF